VVSTALPPHNGTVSVLLCAAEMPARRPSKAKTRAMLSRAVVHVRAAVPVRTFMRQSLYLTPASDYHLQLAAQVGATDITAPFPGPELQQLQAVVGNAKRFGLTVSVIERHLPHEKIVNNLVRGSQLRR
jgi:hypothetical protein